jgi:hypothetical protein
MHVAVLKRELGRPLHGLRSRLAGEERAGGGFIEATA